MKFKYITKPYRHQHTVFQLIKDFDWWAFFWEMGLGKSKITIDCVRNKCYEQQKQLRILAICPNIVLENWRNEFLVHSNIKRIQILQGKKKTRLDRLRYPADVYIINYRGLDVIKDELLKEHFDILIVDECQRVKNPKATCSKITFKLAKRIKYRFLLSGTPILNNAIDIFQQYKVLDLGETFGMNFFAFRNKFFEDENQGFKAKKQYFPKFVQKPDTNGILNKLILTYADIKTKDKCLDLPDKVFMQVNPEMSPDISKAYKEMEKEMITFLEDHQDDPGIATSALIKIIRLAQISSGFIKLDCSDKEVRFKRNSKLDALKEILENITDNHKVIIWASFVNNIEQLSEELQKYNPAVIYGKVKNKAAQIEKFSNDESCRILIANQASVGLGVNLVVADYAIYYSQTYKLEQRLQSQDRNHRIGSEKFTKIIYIDIIHKGTIDEIILNALQRKEDLAKDLLSVKNQLKGGVQNRP